MSTVRRLRNWLARRNPPATLIRRTWLRLEELEERTVPTLLGNQVFPADNPWNQNISAAPAAANSDGIINSIVSRFGDGRLHPDFGQDYGTATDLFGIPYNVVHGNSRPKITVVLDAYADESDPVPAPIPLGAVIEGDFQSGPNDGVDNRGDSHLLIYDVDNNVAYEFGRASRPSENPDGNWHADQESVWDLKANTFRTIGWTSADAAGLSILAGLARPDEGLPVSQGGQGVINHAIRFTLQNSVILNKFLYPASHVANPGNNNDAVQPPMGARFRLKAGVDLSQLNPQSRVIAQAMKDYGMIVADNGSNFFFSGASYAVDATNQRTLTWNDDDIQDTLHGLKSLHFSDFEVVDLTPQVTDLSAHAGAVGTSVTVTGRNFSRASGHLQVLFGSTPATSVTVVDDGHVVATAPAGVGTVDVRVLSGVTTGADPDNLRSPVFGYGSSAVTTGDQFTYGNGTPTPPPNPGPNPTPPPVQGQLQFSAALAGVNENAGSLTLTVTRTGGSTGSVAVGFTTADGTAASGQRYTAASGTLTFAAGETQKAVTVVLLNDQLVEAPTQTFTVTLHDPTGGATLGAPAAVTVAVQDDDLPVVPDAAPALAKLQQAALVIGKSTEHYQDFVTGAYRRFLSRQPDAQGLAYWVTLMQLYETSGHTQGLRQEQIEAGFLDSPEYLGRYGGVGEAWLRGIYQDLLGRAADQAGVDFWMAQLKAGAPPTQVALGFTASDERLQDRVTATYLRLLERAPDQPGLAYWVAIFKAGYTTEDIVSGFVGSPEYYTKPDRGAGNPAKWTRSAYLDVLDRPGSVSEFDYWLKVLGA